MPSARQRRENVVYSGESSSRTTNYSDTETYQSNLATLQSFWTAKGMDSKAQEEGERRYSKVYKWAVNHLDPTTMPRYWFAATIGLEDNGKTMFASAEVATEDGVLAYAERDGTIHCPTATTTAGASGSAT